MAAKTFYYARVSTRGQSLKRQLEQFRQLGADERDIITEKESGKDFDQRAAYLTLRDQLLRPGDTLVVCSLDRLGRNKRKIKQELEYFKENGIRVKILDMPTTLCDYPEEQAWIGEMVNNILIEILGSIAENERDVILKRQREGIEAARKAGEVTFGRPKIERPKNWDSVYSRRSAGEITAVCAMRETGLSRSTFYKFVKEESGGSRSNG